MFVVSIKANRKPLIAVAAVGVALVMLLTRCGAPAPSEEATAAGAPPIEQGETNGTTG